MITSQADMTPYAPGTTKPGVFGASGESCNGLTVSEHPRGKNFTTAAGKKARTYERLQQETEHGGKLVTVKL